MKPEHGFPITLKVPTHVNVWIEEEYYLTTEGEDAGSKVVPVSLGEDGDRITTILTSYEYTDKLFTVDLKRPPVGELRTDVSLDPRDQYFNHIHGKVVDNTIREITDVINQFKPAFATSTSAGDNVKLITAKRTLAYGRFDIDSPTFEAELNSFLDYHMNSCNTCDRYENCKPTDVKGGNAAATGVIRIAPPSPPAPMPPPMPMPTPADNGDVRD